MKQKKNPLIIPRGDGLGWTFNFYNKWSYLVLVAIAGVVILFIWLAITAKK